MKNINRVIFEQRGDVIDIVEGRGVQGRPLGGGDI